MSYGFTEASGLRCNYHGWLFDQNGRCRHQPFEEIRHPDGQFKDKVQIKAYQVTEAAGMIWAYMGPAPAPLLPDWARFHARGFKQIVVAEVPCNWFQCQENSIDPVHFEWLHANWSMVLRGDTTSRTTTPGTRVRRVRVRICLPPHPRGHQRQPRAVDHRPGLPVAQRALCRPFRVAGPDR
jgi:phenylpropionate dioxygenase-like ring-hydroxylating dioxygenase large terminal subunit